MHWEILLISFRGNHSIISCPASCLGQTAPVDLLPISVKPGGVVIAVRTPWRLIIPGPLTPLIVCGCPPARFLEVYRLHVHEVSSLETIHEEETQEDCVETSQLALTSRPSFVSSMCFLEVHRPFPSCYAHRNCQCARKKLKGLIICFYVFL